MLDYVIVTAVVVLVVYVFGSDILTKIKGGHAAQIADKVTAALSPKAAALDDVGAFQAAKQLRSWVKTAGGTPDTVKAFDDIAALAMHHEEVKAA